MGITGLSKRTPIGGKRLYAAVGPKMGRGSTMRGRSTDRQTLLDYAGYLRQQVEHGELATATAQNRLSSVNRTMVALRGDQYVKVLSPPKALGIQRPPLFELRFRKVWIVTK